MLSIKFIRENRDEVIISLLKRKGINLSDSIKKELIGQFGENYDVNSPDTMKFLISKVSEISGTKVDDAINLDIRSREIIGELQEYQQKRNSISKEIGKKKKAKLDCDDLILEVKNFSGKLAQLDKEKVEVKAKLDDILQWIPNMVNDSVPIGGTEEYGELVKESGQKRDFSFEPKPHWDVLNNKKLLHLETGSKLAGSGFPVYSGKFAMLERALVSFMLDTHRKSGFEELSVPYIVNSKTMFGTGQLPKLKDDMYFLDKDDLYLIPTAEVPVTNFYSGEILDVEILPVNFTAFTPCFRREAGSYGKDNRGIMRIHQFNKVELVKLVLPENSWSALDEIVKSAESILTALRLPYRIINLASGDISFAASKCFDLEVWSPGVGKYLEVSSCSNFLDFQARRANIRFKRKKGAKPEFVHTLNGSALALPRTLIAIIENYQNEDGTVNVPEVLKPYIKCDVIK